MKIEYVEMADWKELMKIWRINQKDGVFGIPFKKDLEPMIKEKRFVCIKNNDEIIGLCGCQIMKRNPSLKIKHLWVSTEHRKKGFAIYMINFFIRQYKIRPIIVDCKDGAQNNTFYDKFSLQPYSIRSTKTMRIRQYILDENKIKEFMPSCDNW